MSWQDDLRKLDDELAAGRISADDYRVRRDRVLSSAVTPASQEPLGNEATQLVPVPVPPPTGAPTVVGPPTDQADETQVVPDRTASDVDRTQAVAGWQTERPTDADQTHVVPGVPTQTIAGGHPPRPAPPPSPPGGFPQPPGWQQPYDELGSPWAGSEFPPLAATGTPDWIRQGPEVFDDGRGPGKAGKVVAIVATVIVLAGIAFGAYWIWGRGNDNASGGGTSSTTKAPTTTPSPKPPPDRLPTARFPGKVTENRAVKTFADIPGQSYLTQPEIDAYTAGKGGKTKLVLSDVGDGNRLVAMLVQTPDAASAAAAAAALNQIQIINGMTQSTGGPAKVLVVTREPQGDQKGRLRAHYVNGNIIVRLDLTASTMSDGLSAFNDVLTSQLEVLPADG